jgi:hypothetical protein
VNVLLLLAMACRLPASSGHTPDDGDADSGDPPDDSGLDLDEDGYEAPFDCDDDDATVHPDAPEVCGNGQDDNCLEGPDGCGWSGSQALEGIAVSSEDKNGLAGYALAVCDANGDGQLDVVMSDPFWNEGRGKIFVFYGPVLEPRGVDGADYALEGTEPYASTGLALDCRSDFDGDGAADILASSGRLEEDTTSATFLVPGGRTGGGEISDEATATWLGAHGDVAYRPVAFDGDGNDRDEIAISARSYYGEPGDFGATYLIDDVSLGVRDLESSAFAQVSGTSQEDQLYGAQGNVGDLNGDGGDELAIVGVGVHGGSSFYVFETPLFGSVTSADADTRIVVDAGAGPGGGMSHADLDGDGRDDLLVGSASGDGGGVGGAYVFYGPVDDDTTTKAAPVQIYGGVGASFASFASLGTNSLLVGTPGGAVALYLFEGPLEGVYDAGADAVASWTTGRAHAWAGEDIAIEDVTGDGFADFVIGGAADAEGAGVLIMPSFDL